MMGYNCLNEDNLSEHPVDKIPRTLPLFFFLAVAILAPAAMGQNGESPADTGLREELKVHLVQVNFIATDKSGYPVDNLRPDEIILLDGGKQQKVAFLKKVHVTGSSPGSGEDPYGGLPPGEPTDSAFHSEPAQAAPGAGRWFILVFDNYLSNQLTKIHAVEAALEYAKKTLQPNDKVAVVSFTGETNLIQPFTSDRDRLEDALFTVNEDLDRAIGDRYSKLDDLLQILEECRESNVPHSCAGKYGGSYQEERARETDSFLTMLGNVIRSVAPIPAPKSLILISNGFARNPTQDARDAVTVVLGPQTSRRMYIGQDFRIDEAYDEIAEIASQSGVSIFTINPGGGTKIHAISASRSNINSAINNPLQIDVYDRSDDNFDFGLVDLARRTGGRSTSTPNILKGLDQVAQLSNGLYTVGFYPTGDTVQKQRNIKVKFKRKGVRAITRKEVPTGQRPRPMGGELTLESGECSDAGSRTIRMKVRLDREHLLFEMIDKQYSSNFAFFIQVRRESDEKLLHQEYRYFNASYSEKDYNQNKVQDPVLEQMLVAPCEPVVVEVTTSDSGSGARGVFTGSR
jgi:VWFA-related protein